jgi:hypothetical protein
MYAGSYLTFFLCGPFYGLLLDKSNFLGMLKISENNRHGVVVKLVEMSK